MKSIARCLVALLCLQFGQRAARAEWTEGFAINGLDEPARTSVVFDDGNGPALYAGGSFTTAGGISAAHIARWDGANWSALGTGVDGTVHTLVVFDDGSGAALYAGGDFTTAGGVTANRIARWDGTIWSALGTEIADNIVFSLSVFDDGGGPALYAGGSFSGAGGISDTANIAKWNGTTWAGLGTGVNGPVRAFAVFDDGGGPALFVGGQFVTAGGLSANRIAKWNGLTWSALGTGMNSQVNTLTVFDDGGGPDLYAGGPFTTAGGVTANGIARWNGTSWSRVGSVSANVIAFAVFDDGSGAALYAGGGAFITAGIITAVGVAKWNGTNWSALSAPFNGQVFTIAVFDDGSGAALYAGGDFSDAGGLSGNHMAMWRSGAWSALGSGSGINSAVHALAVFDDGLGPSLYAGGDFNTAGSTVARRIAKWDGTNWSALGSNPAGMNGTVRALVTFDDGSGPALYAGGSFSGANGVAVNFIAKWDGSAWSDLDFGMGGAISPYVYALAVFDDGSGPALYAGGQFTTAGGVSANRIAKWNGVDWSALATGMDGDVWALAVFDDGSGPALHAGGDFTTAGGVSANRIAKWNGSTWSASGTGMNDDVYALTVFDDGGGPALYAGGDFTIAGGASANRMAKWKDSTWSPLGYVGSGMDDAVRALTVFDDGSGPALYAGGLFNTADGYVDANYIAQWDGDFWSALRSGLDGPVFALAGFDGGQYPGLYAGGDFAHAGGLPSSNIAKWFVRPDGEGQCTHWLPSQQDLSVCELFFDPVSALTTWDGLLVAGGKLWNYDSHEGIAAWNDTCWVPIGGGIGCSGHPNCCCGNCNVGPAGVQALASYDGELVIGGRFCSAGSTAVNSIARWNGVRWATLGDGVLGCYTNVDCSQTVSALAVYDRDLIAAGNFNTAGGVESGSLARWDGQNWSTLGDRVFEWCIIGALAVYNNELIVAADCFDKVGNSGAVRWTGVDWLPVGDDPLLSLWAFAHYDGKLVASGSFGSTNIASWDGATWTPLGTGTEHLVWTLAVFNGELIAAGSRNFFGGDSTEPSMSRWDGTKWQPLGRVGGFQYPVPIITDLHVYQGELIVGGGFSNAGGQPNPGWARWGRTTRQGDFDGDGIVGPQDFGEWTNCLTGPFRSDTAAATSLTCLCTFNADGDGDNGANRAANSSGVILRKVFSPRQQKARMPKDWARRKADTGLARRSGWLPMRVACSVR